MKLNYDCLRKLLIEIENFKTLGDDLSYQSMELEEMEEALPKFQRTEIAYTTLKAEEAGLISVNIIRADNGICTCIYYGLTFEGHQFLDNVRNNNIWEKTKSTAKELGCVSLRSLISISEKIVFSIIQSKL